MGKFFTLFILKISLLVLVFSFACQASQAQIMELRASDIKAQTRKSQKEAARFEGDHKETHLDIHNRNLKKGVSGRKKVQVLEEPAEYVYDKEKNAIYDDSQAAGEKPKKRKSKKETK